MTQIKPIIIAISMAFALLATAIVPGANANGQDVPQDLVKAYAWFKISAPNYPLSKVLLKHVEGQLSKDKIALANVLVAAWQRQ